MDRIKVVVFIICLTVPANAGNPEFRKLKAKVDFFLDNIMDVTQNLRGIRDDVTSLQEKLNATLDCDAVQCVASSEKDADTGNQLDVTSTTISDDIEARMTVIQEAFQDEKAVLRTNGQKQKEFIAAIAKTVDDVKVELAKDVALMKSEISNAIADMNSKFNITWSTVAKACVDLSNDIESVDHKLSNEVQHHDTRINDTIKALNAKVDFLLTVVGVQGLVRYRTSVYKVHDELMSWDDAQAKCQEEGFHLAEINDAKEHEFVRMLGGRAVYWVGGSDKAEEGVWRWATSGEDVDMTLFGTGEPNNAGGIEHCMHNHGSEFGHHNDIRCDLKIRFVCEKELN